MSVLLVFKTLSLDKITQRVSTPTLRIPVEEEKLAKDTKTRGQ